MTKEYILELLATNRQQIQENSYYGLEFLEQQNKQLANETDEEVQLNLQFNNSLAQFYFHSNFRKSIEIALTVLNKYPGSTYYAAVGQLYSFTGACHTFINEFEKAEEYLTKALEYADKVIEEKPLLKVAVLQSLFENSFHGKQDPEKAVAFLKQALAVLIEHPEPARLCGCLLQLGLHYLEQADYATALSYLNRAEAGYEQNINLQNMAIVLCSTGRCYYKQGKLDLAEKSMLKALTICHKAATPDNTAFCNFHLAEVYVAQKNWLKALDHAQNSQVIFEEIDNQIQLQEVNKLLIEITGHLAVA